MSLSPPIGVALLSFAHTHQEHWAKALTADPRAVVRAVWDADPGRGAAAAARHATTFEGSLDAVLRRPDVQAVTICSETCRHADLVVAAAAGRQTHPLRKTDSAALFPRATGWPPRLASTA